MPLYNGKFHVRYMQNKIVPVLVFWKY